MTKVVLFDVYGTVAGWEPSRFEIQKAACSAFGFGDMITPDGILNGYGNADAFMTTENAHNPVRLRDDVGKAEFFSEYQRLVVEGCGVHVSLNQALEIFHKVREIPYQLASFGDVCPTFEKLQKLGLMVGLISNIDQLGSELVKDLGLGDLVDFAVTSREAGAEKPNPLIFRAALDVAKVGPEDAIMVGDQPSSDIEGALGVGIMPVLIDRDGNYPCYKRCPRIVGLADLYGILEEL